MFLVVVNTHVFGFCFSRQRTLVQMKVAHPFAATSISLVSCCFATKLVVLPIDPMVSGALISTVGGATVISALKSLFHGRGLATMGTFNGVSHHQLSLNDHFQVYNGGSFISLVS